MLAREAWTRSTRRAANTASWNINALVITSLFSAEIRHCPSQTNQYACTDSKNTVESVIRFVSTVLISFKQNCVVPKSINEFSSWCIWLHILPHCSFNVWSSLTFVFHEYHLTPNSFLQRLKLVLLSFSTSHPTLLSNPKMTIKF
jgi:hypothetical protein